MTPAELRKLGKPHGHGWQTRLARGLSVNPRTVRRWVAGTTPIRPAMAELIRLKLKRPEGQKEEG